MKPAPTTPIPQVAAMRARAGRWPRFGGIGTGHRLIVPARAGVSRVRSATAAVAGLDIRPGPEPAVELLRDGLPRDRPGDAAESERGASTAIMRTPHRQSVSQSGGATSASSARTVSPIRTTWGSHALYAGQVERSPPRRGQGAGGDGRPPLPRRPGSCRSRASAAGRTPCSGSRYASRERSSPAQSRTRPADQRGSPVRAARP